MIFFFSGTGNSLWVAKTLSERLAEPLISIADEQKSGKMEFRYTLRTAERVLFVYPVHSWGPAVSVLRFIARLSLTGYTGQPFYSVCTCGDDCGYTSDMIRKALEKRGFSLTAGYSVTMPNNYILMPGFDVDTKEVEQRKLQEAPARMARIVEAIEKRNVLSLYHTGNLPFLKSRVVNPLFAHFALGRNAFRVTDRCISCGLCESICPTGTILLKEGKPVWADTCVQCVACIHRCPVRAIEYGNGTVKKGRYQHPDCMKK